MCNPLLRNLMWTAPTVAAYLVAAPLVAGMADRGLGLTLQRPPWTLLLALLMVAVGTAGALWCVWLFAVPGQGTPNPLAPPKDLVRRGPYRISRNPIMLCAWLAGIGLAVLMRSPSLLTVYAITIVAGVFYVRRFEEPELARRFGEDYRSYVRSVPRWICCLALLLLYCSTPLRAEAGAEPVPSVVVLIKCKPGTTRQWKEAFEKQIAPSIRAARESGDEITGFEFFENVVAGQPYDFMLVMHAKSFAFFDQPRLSPHYRALFRRLGQEQATRLLGEMESWESAVTVTLVRAYGAPK